MKDEHTSDSPNERLNGIGNDRSGLPIPMGNQGGYGGGYGYGASYGEMGSGSERDFRDYLLMLRERIWAFILIFFVIFTGTLLYTYKAPRIYKAIASVQIYRDDVQLIGEDLNADFIANQEDFNTQVGIFKSYEIVDSVAKRLTPDERAELIKPYENMEFLTGPLSAHEVLAKNRTINPIRLSLIIEVSYEHVNRELATKIANLYATEFVEYKKRKDSETTLQIVQGLERKVQGEREQLQKIQDELVAYRREHKNISVDPEDNIVHEQLNALNTILITDKRALDVAETRWKLVQDFEKSSKQLWDLPFIAEDIRINGLLRDLSSQKIEIATLSKRYRAKHPKMIQAQKGLLQVEAELETALKSIVKRIEVEFVQAENNYATSLSRLADKEQEVLDLSNLSVEYNSLHTEYRTKSNVYQLLLERLYSEQAKMPLQRPSAGIIDPAFEPLDFYKPRIGINIALGFFGGIGLGLAFVFASGLMNDRIRSALDIESSLGLSLIGVVPRLKRMELSEKARAVALNSDRRVTEAFRSIHSALKINESSSRAKIIVTTSTSPSEGKSFVSTNLALTFASHGERTLILDSDLRMPNVARSLSIDEHQAGINQYFNDNQPLDKVIIKNFYPNLDVLTAGGKSRNPTQILNSPYFGKLLEELSPQYDRIIIDSPPVAAVSDVITIMPYVDGLVYVIKYNATKQKVVKSCLRRLADSNKPIFGAILNQISMTVENHYYSDSYEDYYRFDESDRVPGRDLNQRKEPSIPNESTPPEERSILSGRRY